MSRFSNVAHYQDYSELEHILETSNNQCDMEKIRSAYAFAEKCLRYVTTNIGQTDLMSMLLDVPEILDYEQVSVRIPIDKTHHSKKIQGTYVLVIDLKRNSDYWYNLVYKDKDISEEIYREMEEEKAAKEKAEKQADVSSGT